VAEMTGDVSVVTLDRLWSANIADPGRHLLDVVFDAADFATLRRLVTKHCAAAGLTGSRLDDFVLAVHEISVNVVIHSGARGRLILRRAAHGIRCLIADAPKTRPSCPPPHGGDTHDPAGSDSGRGLWLAATLADELSITSGPDSTIVSLYMRLD